MERDFDIFTQDTEKKEQPQFAGIATNKRTAMSKAKWLATTGIPKDAYVEHHGKRIGGFKYKGWGSAAQE